MRLRKSTSFRFVFMSMSNLIFLKIFLINFLVLSVSVSYKTIDPKQAWVPFLSIILLSSYRKYFPISLQILDMSKLLNETSNVPSVRFFSQTTLLSNNSDLQKCLMIFFCLSLFLCFPELRRWLSLSLI